MPDLKTRKETSMPADILGPASIGTPATEYRNNIAKLDEIDRNFAALRDENAALRRRFDAAEAVCVAAQAMLDLPNVEHRVGPWDDVNDAVKALRAAVAAWDAAKGGR